MARVHRKVLSNALYIVVLLGATFDTVSFHFLRGSHPFPDQLPGEHTGLYLM